MRKPTTNQVTQTAAQHGYEATDYSFLPDEWVYAPETGVVEEVHLNAGDCGKRIQFRGNTTQALYYMCHFKDVGVSVGQIKREGEKLGIMGETGKAFGRHLHLVIIVGGKRVPDPDKWLNERVTKENKMYNGKTAKQWFEMALGYDRRIKKHQSNEKAFSKQIADLKKALANEKAKPPVQVIKEVEKIVEKEVIKEVPVGEETAVRGFLDKLLNLIFKKG